MKLLVVRNDRLGDFMLAWPALAVLKQSHPEAVITALVPAYTAPIAHLCPWIDEVLIDDGSASIALSRQLRKRRFDGMITYFSTGRVALAGCLARIPYRLAPATKLAQLCYNHRLTQRRSRSEKPEYAYNIDLSLRFLADRDGLPFSPVTAENGDYLPAQLERPLLRLTPTEPDARQRFCRSQGLPESSTLLFIHPGSGGSANNLRPDQYAALANAITVAGCAFVITAGPGEEAIAREVADAINAPVSVFAGTGGLPELARTLQHASLFISGSTGPLHIAGALDIPTVAFYPGHRSATPLRWETLNAPSKRLAFTPPSDGDEREVQSIDIAGAAVAVSEHLSLQLSSQGAGSRAGS